MKVATEATKILESTSENKRSMSVDSVWVRTNNSTDVPMLPSYTGKRTNQNCMFGLLRKGDEKKTAVVYYKDVLKGKFQSQFYPLQGKLVEEC